MVLDKFSYVIVYQVNKNKIICKLCSIGIAQSKNNFNKGKEEAIINIFKDF